MADNSFFKVIKKFNGPMGSIQAAEKLVTEDVARQIGEAVKKEMLDMISKGISPVRGPDVSARFPAYKAVAVARGKSKNLKDMARDHRDKSKAMKAASKVAYGKTAKEADKKAAAFHAMAAKAKSGAAKEAVTQGKGYPYSVAKKFPDKRLTPVNLTLSGDMLDHLTFKPVKTKNGYGVELYYDDALSDKKERGHAEGVNGQPKRPTIPDVSRGQSHAATLDQIVRTILANLFKK